MHIYKNFEKDGCSNNPVNSFIDSVGGDPSCNASLDQKFSCIEKSVYDLIKAKKIFSIDNGLGIAMSNIHGHLRKLSDEYHFLGEKRCKLSFNSKMDRLCGQVEILFELFSPLHRNLLAAGSSCDKRYTIQTNSINGQRLRQVILLIDDIAMIAIHSLQFCYFKAVICFKKVQILLINRQIFNLRKSNKHPVQGLKPFKDMLIRVNAKKMKLVKNFNVTNEMIDQVVASHSARMLGQRVLAKQTKNFSIFKQIFIAQQRAEKSQNFFFSQKDATELSIQRQKFSPQIDLSFSSLNESMRDLVQMRSLLAREIERSGPLRGVGETLLSVFECGLDVLD